MTDNNSNKQTQDGNDPAIGENQEQQTSQSDRSEQTSGNNPNADPNYMPAKTGAVIDPENDGRLKENRVEGRTKGTTSHSEKAPHVDENSEGSVNSEDRPAQEIYAERNGQTDKE